MTWGGPVGAPLGIGLGAYLVIGAALEIVTRAKGKTFGLSLRRAAGLRSAWGTALAHAGVGVTVIGIAAQAWSVESLATVQRGGSCAPAPTSRCWRASCPHRAELHRDRRPPDHPGRRRAGRRAGAGKRFYASRNMSVSEAGLLTRGVSQVYASVGETGADGSVGIRLYYKPLCCC